MLCVCLFVKQSPERDANGRPIRKSRRQTVDLKVLLGNDDSDHHSYADNSDDDSDDDSDEDEGAGASRKQSRPIIDNSSPNDKDLKDSNVATDMDSKLLDRTASDAEPPKKRRKLIEVENQDKTGESISLRSRGRKKVLKQKRDEYDEDDVEKWAKAIIKYHQQTEDIRTRYVSCCVIELCVYPVVSFFYIHSTDDILYHLWWLSLKTWY